MRFDPARRIGFALAALSLISLPLLSSAQNTVPPPPAAFTTNTPWTPVALTTVPVPDDPLELVTSGARLVQSGEERAEMLDLLIKAHRLSNVRLHAYELKTTFTSYGSSTSDGRWILDDTSPGPEVYRWTAEGPSFSGIFLAVNRLLSSNQSGGAMPLRLAQVRDAMWSAYLPEIGPHATLRVASGYLGGAELRCVLVAHGFYQKAPPPFASGRSFDESEYCVNPQSGLLEMFSRYPGVYVRYDYSNHLRFHEQTIPDGFTITEHGKTLIQAKTESVGDAPPANSGLFEPSGLRQLGVGQLVAAPMQVRSFQSSPSVDGSSPPQVVVLHGMVSPEGQFSEVEILATTNSALDDAAVAHANRAHSLQAGAETQPGVTPQSREVIFTVEFLPPPRPPIPSP
jgi:hypothetical protein